MKRLALFLVLPALTLSLAACGADPAPSTVDDAAAPAATPEAAPEATLEAPPQAAPPAVGILPGELIPAFTAEGTAGDASRSVASQEPGAVTVYCAGSTKCPITNAYAERMQQIESTYTEKGVQFIWIYPNRTETDDAKTAWHAEKDLAGTFVIDRDASIAKVLEIKRTPEIVVTAADGTITYRGAIDDGKGKPSRAEVPWLANALDATLAGEPVAVEKTVPAG